MNGLSWLLYGAEVLGNVRVFVEITTFFGLFILGGSAAMYYSSFSASMCPYNLDHKPAAVDRAKAWMEKASVFGKAFFKFWVVAGLLALLLPTKETLYLIAGSEIGEMAVTSDYGKDILGDIKDVIDHQLKSLRGEDGS